MKIPVRRPLIFIGSALKDLRQFPERVRGDVGFELDAVQCGEVPSGAKQLKGLAGVMELVERYNTDTYRAVYTVNLGEKVYVLHCFKKKSKKGIKTPKHDIDVIKQRLKHATKLSIGEENG